ncbi:unnamed protein product [Caenorhabditis angaria]|uniref:Tudor domain-containing protein n=1 Tax=Caenorhabditis angaria TaxID=860376 RepID=A0A9P1I6E5_9PELO|nr:unnamed protein product [Caenorhabditis angaria]
MAEIFSKNEDVWDDTELIKMYEESISSTYKKVQKSQTSAEYTTSDGKKYTWKIGSKCMAPYRESAEQSEEEIEYFPAIIDWISENQKEAKVTFDGYGNQELVKIQDLWDENEIVETEETDGAETDVVMESPKPVKNSSSKKKHHHHQSSSTHSKLPILAPPPPPGLLNMVAPDETEALSSMLMSWYMSGYHTGYYQAISDSKKSHSRSK